ncbi:MAG TPA: peptidase M3, partial [Bacteroidales bacterium]|nr:peptidase M3 [Bacteroidales bacterium]
MKKIFITAIAIMSISACSQKNVFLSEWDTPYGIPPYDKIKISDYLPAIKEGIKQHDAEIEAITSCVETPTFENTIAPLELSGELLQKVTGVLFNVSETDRSDALD